ncbi:MAG: competence/damage-inducible protein A [Tannerellaceae bacterium]|nr:competence/damage-inducible protein A [Tannerellaceae bacterium]
MDAAIVTIGDELLIGQVVDINSAWLGEMLGNEGFRVVWKTTVGDNKQAIRDAFDAAFNHAPVVIVSGGIGPTKDDITKRTLCNYFGSTLYFSEEVYKTIEQLFQATGREMNELTCSQAMVPDNCTIIPNEAGTAPGTWFERDGKVLVSLPGVPSELKWLMANGVMPRLKKRFGQDLFIRHHTLWVTGYTESKLAIQLAGFEQHLPAFVKLAYLPQPFVIRLRLSAYAKSEQEAIHTIEEQKQKLYVELGDHILADEDKSPVEVLGELLKEKGLTMGTAESCTAGGIASLVASIPGCSAYFYGGVVSYSNEVKKKTLGVSPADLENYGAVSQPVVEQMALGAIKEIGCDCAVATSGIAGPTGGTPEKPVGTVWIAAAIKDKVISHCYHFGTVREQNIQRAIQMAILMLLRFVQQETT